MKLVIIGKPITKKNSLRRIRRGKRTLSIPSAAHEKWAGEAERQLREQHAEWEPYDFPVNLCAIVYRATRGRADLNNYLAAICDVLEKAKVVEDDALVAGFDGSRLRYDKTRPRVEIELGPLAEPEAEANLKK